LAVDVGCNFYKPREEQRCLWCISMFSELKLALKDEVAIIGKVDTQLKEGFSGVFGSFTVRF